MSTKSTLVFVRMNIILYLVIFHANNNNDDDDNDNNKNNNVPCAEEDGTISLLTAR